MPENDRNSDSIGSSDSELSRVLPKGRKLSELPADLVEEQKSILFYPKKIIAERFEIIEELGFGGVGAVYKVQDRLFHGQLNALKVMLPSLVRSYEARERFILEAQRAKTLRHEGIVAVYDVGEDKEEDILFLIMELLDGQNLENYLESRHGRLGFTESCDIILQICDVLQYAHKRGVSHGGIKPQNIFINPEGGVKLLDFGLAKLLSPGRLTRFSVSALVLTAIWLLSSQQGKR
ncbi:serine/threonine protein kinase [bacterium]|nr:MAG: serine/threonine protein kinase [bacterium]